jgi:hypothetical protein
MSIAIMTHVWERSQHKGSELLLLLAIADNANDQGIAYPSLRTLARKIRMSRRNVIFLVKRLVASGELRVETGTSRQWGSRIMPPPPRQQLQRRHKAGGHVKGIGVPRSRNTVGGQSLSERGYLSSHLSSILPISSLK